MRLTDLEPEWLRYRPGEPASYLLCERHEANGIWFLCPKCFEANGGSVGTHRVICWDPSVPPEVQPNPGRWTLQGDTFETLSLVAGSSSVWLMGRGCQAHFFIEAGEIRMV